MTPYILFLMVSAVAGPEWASSPVVIDMPSAEVCQEASRNWTTAGIFKPGRFGAPGFYYVRGWCLTRDGKLAP